MSIRNAFCGGFKKAAKDNRVTDVIGTDWQASRTQPDQICSYKDQSVAYTFIFIPMDLFVLMSSQIRFCVQIQKFTIRL